MLRLAILFPLYTSAAGVQLTFQVQPSSSTGTGTFRIGTQLSETHYNSTFQVQNVHNFQYGGTLNAHAEVDSTTGQLTQFRFTGGGITIPAQTAVNELFFGNVSYTVGYSTSGFMRRPQSSAPQAIVNGSFDVNLHSAPYSAGTVNIQNFRTAVANPISTFTQNLSANPDTLYNDTFVQSSIANSLNTHSAGQGSPLSKPYTASLFLVVASPSFRADAMTQAAGLASNQKFRMRYSEFGTISAIANYEVPTPFSDWARSNELNLVTGFERNESNQSYALLYAFGLAPDARSVPFAFLKDPNSIRLTLPESGLGFALAVEYSPDLLTPWSTLPNNAISGGTLNKGSSGERTITYPSGASGFLRLRVIF